MNKNNNSVLANSQSDEPADQVAYRSRDGQFEVVVKTATAWREPKHNYPIVCLRLRPQSGTRIQWLRDGTEGLDVLLTHREVAAHLTALNEADPKGGYTFNEVPEKSDERKGSWNAFLAARWKKWKHGK